MTRRSRPAPRLAVAALLFLALLAAAFAAPASAATDVWPTVRSLQTNDVAPLRPGSVNVLADDDPGSEPWTSARIREVDGQPPDSTFTMVESGPNVGLLSWSSLPADPYRYWSVYYEACTALGCGTGFAFVRLQYPEYLTGEFPRVDVVAGGAAFALDLPNGSAVDRTYTLTYVPDPQFPAPPGVSVTPNGPRSFLVSASSTTASNSLTPYRVRMRITNVWNPAGIDGWIDVYVRNPVQPPTLVDPVRVTADPATPGSAWVLDGASPPVSLLSVRLVNPPAGLGLSLSAAGELSWGSIPPNLADAVYDVVVEACSAPVVDACRQAHVILTVRPVPAPVVYDDVRNSLIAFGGPDIYVGATVDVPLSANDRLVPGFTYTYALVSTDTPPGTTVTVLNVGGQWIARVSSVPTFAGGVLALPVRVSNDYSSSYSTLRVRFVPRPVPVAVNDTITLRVNPNLPGNLVAEVFLATNDTVPEPAAASFAWTQVPNLPGTVKLTAQSGPGAPAGYVVVTIPNTAAPMVAVGRYRICTFDAPVVCSSEASVTFNLDAVALRPVAVSDTASVKAGESTVTANLVSNDLLYGNGVRSAGPLSNPTTPGLSPTPSWVGIEWLPGTTSPYSPGSVKARIAPPITEFPRTLTVGYSVTVKDHTYEGSLQITIDPNPIAPPEVNADSVTVAVGSSRTFGLLDNDRLRASGWASVELINTTGIPTPTWLTVARQTGIASINPPNGTVPNVQTVRYRACTAAGVCGDADLIVTTTPGPPLAPNLAMTPFRAGSEGSLAIAPEVRTGGLANLVVAVVPNAPPLAPLPSGITARMDTGRLFVAVARGVAPTTVSVTYRACVDLGGCSQGVVTVPVLAGPPTAVDDVATPSPRAGGAAVIVELRANDITFGEDATGFTPIQRPGDQAWPAWVTLDPVTGRAVITAPPAQPAGDFQLRYRIATRAGNGDAFLRFSVLGAVPVANGGSMSVAAGQAGDLDLGATDLGGPPWSFAMVTSPLPSGIASATFTGSVLSVTAASDASPGARALRYRLTTPNGSAEATVTITVTLPAPAARDDAVSIVAGKSLVVDVVANDTLGGQAVTSLDVVSAPTPTGRATATVDPATRTVTVRADRSAGGTSASATYRVCTLGGCTTASIALTIKVATGWTKLATPRNPSAVSPVAPKPDGVCRVSATTLKLRLSNPAASAWSAPADGYLGVAVGSVVTPRTVTVPGSGRASITIDTGTAGAPIGVRVVDALGRGTDWWMATTSTITVGGTSVAAVVLSSIKPCG